MADPVTNNFGFVLPTVGGDINLWGAVLNSGVIAALDATLGSNISIPITSSDVNLTDAQMQNAIFVLSGVLTGNRNLIIPLNNNSPTVAVGGKFVIVNNTTGAFNVTVKTAASGSTGVVIPQGFVVEVYSDGTNVGYAVNGIPGFLAASNGNPNGQLAGTAGSVNTNASMAYDYTNGIFYICTTTGNSSGAVWSQPVIIVPRGFDTAVNLGLSVTHTGGNLLNIAIKQANGSDPTVLSPVIVNFQTVSGGNTTGVPTSVSITAALSMNTFATGASMGATVANQPFRVWFALFNNGGVAVPAMGIFRDTIGNVQPVSEYGTANTTAITSGATSSGVWYTPNGTSLTGCAYRLIGYAEYTSGLATPGSYTSDPNNSVIFGPGIKKPGDLVQRQSAFTTSSTTTGGGPTQTSTSVSITPTSTINPIYVEICGALGQNTGSATGLAKISRGTVPTILPNSNWGANTGLGGTMGQTLRGLDLPATISSVSYWVYITASAGTTFWNTAGLGGSSATAEEIMG